MLPSLHLEGFQCCHPTFIPHVFDLRPLKIQSLCLLLLYFMVSSVYPWLCCNVCFVLSHDVHNDSTCSVCETWFISHCCLELNVIFVFFFAPALLCCCFLFLPGSCPCLLCGPAACFWQHQGLVPQVVVARSLLFKQLAVLAFKRGCSFITIPGKDRQTLKKLWNALHQKNKEWPRQARKRRSGQVASFFNGARFAPGLRTTPTFKRT